MTITSVALDRIFNYLCNYTRTIHAILRPYYNYDWLEHILLLNKILCRSTNPRCILDFDDHKE